MRPDPNQPNCYLCQHRRTILGITHSACAHPAVADIATSELLLFAVTIGDMQPMELARLGVTGHQQGIKRGWFAWPVNYDPVWLLSCDGFELETLP